MLHKIHFHLLLWFCLFSRFWLIYLFVSLSIFLSLSFLYLSLALLIFLSLLLPLSCSLPLSLTIFLSIVLISIFSYHHAHFIYRSRLAFNKFTLYTLERRDLFLGKHIQNCSNSVYFLSIAHSLSIYLSHSLSLRKLPYFHHAYCVPSIKSKPS